MIFSFGDYQLDEERFELRRHGRIVEVQPKVLELLLHLTRHRARVVPKRAILEAVWPDAAVTPGSLARAVSLARAAIGDRGAHPRVIVTVPRRGYRFEGPLREASRPSVRRKRLRGVSRGRGRDAGVSDVIGRESELAAIERLLSDAREGSATLLLEGEAGIGKTTLFREALRRAEAHGFHVLACRPGASEATLSLAAVADLFGAAPAAQLEALPAPQRRALDAALLRIDPGERLVDQRAVAVGVRSLVTNLAAERPVLLAIDDVQWLDPASAAALEFVLRRLGPERVAVLATRRLLEPVRLDLEALVPRYSLTCTRMGPLSLGALQRLLGERVGGTFPRSTLVRIHGSSGGNPLFALEIARALADRRATPGNEPLPVPADIRELVRERVVALPVETRDLLLAAALLAHPGVDTLRRARGCPADDDLEPAERAGIAALDGGAVRFAHPLHAAAVIASATAAERQRMHLRLAGAVEELEQRAQHLAFGSSEPDEATARLLEDGAAAARSRGGLHAAADLLERARELTPPGAVAAARARGIRASELHIHAGDRTRARRLLDELLAEPLARAQRAEALRLLAELSLAEEDLPTSERLLLEAVAVADEPRSRARIQTELAYVVAHRMDFPRAAEFGHQALESLAGCDDGPQLAEALAYCANADYLAGRGVDWSKVERALALEDPSQIGLPGLPPRGVAALMLMYVGRHAEARRLLDAVRIRLAERGDEADLGHALLWLSWLETRCGNFAKAAEVADDAITCTSLTGDHSLRRWAVGQRAWVDAHLGELDAARRGCVEAAPSDQRGIAQVDLWIAATLALIGTSTGDYAAAWGASRELTEGAERRGIGEPIPFVFLPDALEALVALGQLDRAEALIDLFEARGRELDRSWALATGRRCRGLLLAARADGPGAAAALEQALAHHERIDMPFERARSLLVQGSIERRARRRARASQALEEALAEFERMGAKLWAERARVELDRVGGRRPRSPGELTPSERRVVELVAEGLSNQEIAATLFVSVHTVEVHLSHAYTKLGVHSRARLARRLGASTK